MHIRENGSKSTQVGIFYGLSVFLIFKSEQYLADIHIRGWEEVQRPPHRKQEHLTRCELIVPVNTWTLLEVKTTSPVLNNFYVALTEWDKYIVWMLSQRSYYRFVFFYDIGAAVF